MNMCCAQLKSASIYNCVVKIGSNAHVALIVECIQLQIVRNDSFATGREVVDSI